jgi:protein-S-isoprenylcysteine O-methyltransferase Ste14
MGRTTPAPEDFGSRGGRWVLAQSALLLVVVIAGPVGRSTPTTWTFSTAAILFATAAAIGIAGVRQLGRNRTPYPVPRDDSQLITRGIYGLIRHPLYTCLILASLGWSGVFHSRTALMATLPLAVLLVAKSRYEERRLAARFPDYEEYRRRVAAFLPGIW